MTRVEAYEGINQINNMSLKEVQEMYNVDTREEIIQLIEEEIEEEETSYTMNDIANENGFISEYAAASYLY